MDEKVPYDYGKTVEGFKSAIGSPKATSTGRKSGLDAIIDATISNQNTSVEGVNPQPQPQQQPQEKIPPNIDEQQSFGKDIWGDVFSGLGRLSDYIPEPVEKFSGEIMRDLRSADDAMSSAVVAGASDLYDFAAAEAMKKSGEIMRDLRSADDAFSAGVIGAAEQFYKEDPLSIFSQQAADSHVESIIADANKNIERAKSYSPDTYRGAKTLAEMSGIDIEAVMSKVPSVQKELDAAKASNIVSSGNSPKLSSFLASNRDFAVQSLGETEIYAEIESAVNKLSKHVSDTSGYVRNSYRAGLAENRIGEIGERMRSGSATKEEMSELPGLNEFTRNVSDENSFLSPAARVLGNMVPAIPEIFEDAAIGAAAFALLPIPGSSVVGALSLSALRATAAKSAGKIAANMMARGAGYGASYGVFETTRRVEGGHAYIEMKENGVSDKSASEWSFGVGVANGIVEASGFHFLSKLLPSSLGRILGKNADDAVDASSRISQPTTLRASLLELGKIYGGTMLTEVLTETVQESVTFAANEFAKLSDNSEYRNKFSTEEGLNEYVDRISDIAVSTMKAMAVLGLVPVGVEAVSKKIQASKVMAAGEEFRDIIDAASRTKLRERDSKLLSDYIAHSMSGTDRELAYIDTATLQEILVKNNTTVEDFSKVIFQDEAAAEEFLDEYNTAFISDGQVKVPLSVFASANIDSSLSLSISENLRMEPDWLSVSEAKVVDKDWKQARKGLSSAYDANTDHAIQISVSKHEAYEHLLSMLKSNPDYRTDEGQAEKSAEFLATVLTVAAAEMDTNPLNLINNLGIKIDTTDRGTLETIGAWNPQTFTLWLNPIPLEVDGRSVGGFDAIVHEAGHMLLDIYAQAYKGKYASDNVKAQLEKIAKFMGSKDPDDLVAILDSPSSKSIHEHFAFNFALFFSEAEHIDPRFYSFVMDVAKSMKKFSVDPNVSNRVGAERLYSAYDYTSGSLKHNTPSMSTVFQSLIDVERAVVASLDRLGVAPMNMAPTATGVTVAEYKEYLKSMIESIAKASASAALKVDVIKADRVNAYLDSIAVPVLDEARNTIASQKVRTVVNRLLSGNMKLDRDDFRRYLKKVRPELGVDDFKKIVYKKDAGGSLVEDSTVSEPFWNGGAPLYKWIENGVEQVSDQRPPISIIQSYTSKYSFIQEFTFGPTGLDSITGSIRQTKSIHPSRIIRSHGVTTLKSIDPAIPDKITISMAQAAMLFGYADPLELIIELDNLKHSEIAIREEVASIRDVRRYIYTSSANFMADVLAELHKNFVGDFITTDLKFLDKIVNGQNVAVSKYRHASEIMARKIVGKLAIAGLKPEKYIANEAKFSKEASVKLAAGDAQGAFTAKQKQLLSYRVASIIEEYRGRIAENLKKWNEFIKRDQQQVVALGYDADLIEIAKSIWQLYGIMESVRSEKSLLSITDNLRKLKEYSPEQFYKIFPILEHAIEKYAQDVKRMRDEPAKQKDPYEWRLLYRDLTMDEFEEVAFVVNATIQQASDVRDVTIASSSTDIAKQAEEIVDVFGNLTPLNPPAGERTAVTKKEKFRYMLYNMRNYVRRVEHYLKAIDTHDFYERGVFEKFIWLPVKNAVNTYVLERNARAKMLSKIIEAFEFDKHNAPIYSYELGYTFKNKAELMGAVAHSGNMSNLRKLLLGRSDLEKKTGWSKGVLPDGSLHTKWWDSFIDRMVNEGKITDKDMRLMQKLWNLNESMLPLTQKAFHSMKGFFFKEQKPRTIVLSIGTFKGGYVPAMFASFSEDHLVQKPIRHLSAAMTVKELEDTFVNSLPVLTAGFTHSRVEYNKPLELDLRIVAKHIDDAMRLAYVLPPVKKVLLLLMNDDVQKAWNKYDNGAIRDMMLPWLIRTAAQELNRKSGHPLLDNYILGVRAAYGLAVMFLNLSNAALQSTGIFVTASKVSWKSMASAYHEYMRKGPGALADSISNLSPYMEDRYKSQIYDIDEEIRSYTKGNTALDKARTASRKHGYILQRIVQNFVDTITWTAAYNEKFAELIDDLNSTLSEAEKSDAAILHADSVVRLTQGSVRPEDSPAYEHTYPALRLFTQFTSFFNTQLNLLIDIAEKHSEDKNKIVNRELLLAILVPAVVGRFIEILAFGQAGDFDKDGDLWDDASLAFFRSFWGQLSSYVPFAGSFVAMLPSLFTEESSDDKTPVPPAIRGIISSMMGLSKFIRASLSEDKDVNWRNIKDSISFVSIFSGVPLDFAGKSFSYWYGVKTGAIVPSSTFDYVRGLLTGRASASTEGTKQ